MKTISLKFAVFYLLTTSIAISKPAIQDTHLVDNCLSLEWEAGGIHVPEDYLLVRPTSDGIAVDHSGNLFVMDENRIKVFDSIGAPLKIIGRPGQGPGEFENCRRLTISESGYLTVSGGVSGYTVHVFSPELVFLDRFNYRAYQPLSYLFSGTGYIPDRPRRVISYDWENRIYYLLTREFNDGFTGLRKQVLVYENPDSARFICEYQSTSHITADLVSTAFPFLGTLHSGVLEGKRIVYTHTVFDVEHTEEGNFYLLRVINLQHNHSIVIRHRYTPVPITDRDTERWRIPFTNLPDTRSREAAKKLVEAVDDRLKKETYKASLLGLLTDRHFIFAITYTMRDNSHVLTDVFDANNGAYLSSVYLPCSRYDQLSIAHIRDGNAYEISNYSSEEPEDPLVRMYRIDPEVYTPAIPPMMFKAYK